MLQLEKYVRIKNQLQDILSGEDIFSDNRHLTQDKRLFLDEIVNDLTTIADMERSEAFLCDQVKEMTKKLKTKIDRNMDHFLAQDIHNILSRLLVLITKDLPLNLRAPYGQGWLCPLSLKSLYFYYHDHTHQSIALTSGYLYDRTALVKWFQQHFDCLEPITKTPLTQLDVEKIIKSTARTEVLQKIDNEYTNLYNTYHTQQQNRFNKSYLSSADRLKKDFITTISHKEFSSFAGSCSKTHNINLINLQKNIKECGIKQQPESIFNENPVKFDDHSVSGLLNFNNLNLSGLLFEKENRFSASTFCNTDFSNSIFMHADINTCDFTGANLENVRFISDRKHHSGYDFKYVNFTNANLKNVEFPYFYGWNGVNMAGANLSGAYVYNSKGEKIFGEKLNRFLLKHNVNGLDTAIFSQNNNNNNNNNNVTTPTNQNTSDTPQEKSASTSQQGFFRNTNDNTLKQEMDSLRQQNQQLQQQLQQQSQQIQQQNTLLQQQNRLFSQHLQQLQPQQQPQQQQHQHHLRNKEYCIVM